MNRFNSVVMEYRGINSSNDVGTLDGSVALQQALNLQGNKRVEIKPISCQMSSRIPNIFSYGNFNNRIIRVKRDLFDPWTIITLTPGIYKTVSEIEAAITDVISTWMTDPYDSAIQLNANTVTDQVYVILDSSKLALGGHQACIDFSQSQIYNTLGFPLSACTFIADGLYTSSNVVRMDQQGTYCDVVMSLCNTRVVNGVPKKVLFSVPLVLMSNTLTEYLYPPFGSETETISYSGSSFINSYVVEFKTQNNIPMVWLAGSKVQVTFELRMEL